MDQHCNGQFLLKPFAIKGVYYLKKMLYWTHIYHVNLTYQKSTIIRDVLRDLVSFIRFKKCESSHGGVLILIKLQALVSHIHLV